jgi:hypothetical protein
MSIQMCEDLLHCLLQTVGRHKGECLEQPKWKGIQQSSFFLRRPRRRVSQYKQLKQNYVCNFYFSYRWSHVIMNFLKCMFTLRPEQMGCSVFSTPTVPCLWCWCLCFCTDGTSSLWSENLKINKSGLWIRIDCLRIRIQIQHFCAIRIRIRFRILIQAKTELSKTISFPIFFF